MFHTKFVKKMKRHILFAVTFFLNIMPLTR